MFVLSFMEGHRLPAVSILPALHILQLSVQYFTNEKSNMAKVLLSYKVAHVHVPVGRTERALI